MTRQESRGPDLADRRALDRLLDAAVRRADKGEDAVAELRREHAGISPAELIGRLEKRYLARSARLGGAVGAVAAFPGIGTLAAVGLTGAQTAAFLSASANHVMAVAAVHGVAVDDVERRRALLLAALLGEDGAKAVSGQLGLGTLYWARAALTRLPLGTIRAVNKTLTRRLVQAGLARAGAVSLGRLAPFGVGAVIGYQGTKIMGKNVLDGTREAFGPPPATFGATS
ncbi:hypothetical protein GCM10023169_11240 [Georgenia halophila]|uniref:EcsC family protein n=1 Tax=Georgenia halophila TaxID=620889 RepID=A0ABP8KUG2_9MICO